MSFVAAQSSEASKSRLFKNAKNALIKARKAAVMSKSCKSGLTQCMIAISHDSTSHVQKKKESS